MGRFKGQTREIVIPLKELRVAVECDPDEGFNGSLADLEEAVKLRIVEDINDGVNMLATDGEGWVLTDITVIEGGA